MVNTLQGGQILYTGLEDIHLFTVTDTRDIATEGCYCWYFPFIMHPSAIQFPQATLTFELLKKFKMLLSHCLCVGCLQLETRNVDLLIS